MAETNQPEGGLFATFKRMLATFRDILENRFELFLTELEEERIRLFDALLLALVGVVCALMALIVLTFIVVVIFWDTHRILALALFGLVYAGLAVTVFWILRSRLPDGKLFRRQWNKSKRTARVSKNRIRMPAFAQGIARGSK
ncbi:MAG TPA: phage holin family protein [Verrucomicrobiae bacterium]|nr:phage holin family protein [Verrucomicrobiae bacterium]